MHELTTEWRGLASDKWKVRSCNSFWPSLCKLSLCYLCYNGFLQLTVSVEICIESLINIRAPEVCVEDNKEHISLDTNRYHRMPLYCSNNNYSITWFFQSFLCLHIISCQIPRISKHVDFIADVIFTHINFYCLADNRR